MSAPQEKFVDIVQEGVAVIEHLVARAKTRGDPDDMVRGASNLMASLSFALVLMAKCTGLEKEQLLGAIGSNWDTSTSDTKMEKDILRFRSGERFW